MATLYGGQILRQYCNKRIQKKQTEICDPATVMDRVKDQSSVFTMSPFRVKDSHSVTASEPIKLKSLPDSEVSASQPKVIVRKFTLPPSRNAYALPFRSKNTNFGKPKQRWKQLCNLQHEMTTTLPVTRVKMLGPSTPLTREYRPGTLQSHATGKLDVTNSTVQQLLTVKKADKDSSTPSNKGSSNTSSSSPVRIKTFASPIDTVDSNTDDVDVEEILLDTAEEVPEVAAVAEVSSTGGTVRFGPFDTTQSNIGIVGGKFVIFQPLSATKQVIQHEGGNSKVNTIVLNSSQGAAVDTMNGKKVIKPFVYQKEVTSNLLKTTLLQGNVKPGSELATKEHGVVYENLKHSSEPSLKRQNVVWGSLKHNSRSVIKEQNVVWANVKHNSLPNKKQQNVHGNLKRSSELPEQNVKLGNLKNGTEPASKEQDITHEDMKHNLEPSDKEQDGVTHRSLKTISEPAGREQNVVTVHPMPQETNSLKVARDFLRDILTKSVRATAVGTPQQDPMQSKNIKLVELYDKPAEDANTELKQLQQLQHEILMMKRRQNIAMQVEREVLRAKDIKLVQEVQLPARKVLLSEMGTQTNLFSLVEPGRMIEMMISTDNTEEPGKMVSSKVKPMTGEDSAMLQKPSGFVLNAGTVPKIVLPGSGRKLVVRAGEIGEKGVEKNVPHSGGTMTASDEPDKKRVRLDVTLKSQNDPEGTAASDAQVTQVSSDAMLVDPAIDMANVEFQNSSQHKKMNVNIASLSSSQSVENSKPESLHNVKTLRNTSIPVRGLPVVTNLQASNKTVKSGSLTKSERDVKSVYDIIVQHNIAAQTKSQPKQKMTTRGIVGNENRTAPMVYFPDSDLLNTTRNTNTQERVAKMTKGLIHQAYEDWVHCSIPDENGNIPLHKAVINENITLVKRQCVVLCARKSKLDICNYDKETPLHLAVLSGNAEVTQMLLSFGAQPSVKDSIGNTALHLAVLHGNLDCLKAILNTNNTESLPLDDFNDEGYSPMHLCALNGKVEETKCLIIKGAEVNLKDAKSGRTPLFHAVEANNRDLVQLLLAYDANPNEANFSGHTPLSAASEISFSCKNTAKEYLISEGINCSSKLVPLSRGSDVTHTFNEGSNIVFGEELLGDVHMDEVHDGDLTAHCYSSATTNSNNNNNVNPWFLND